MYRIEHTTDNMAGTNFVTVDDNAKTFIAGNTAACVMNIGQDYTITTHATYKELKNLQTRLIESGYTPCRADYFESVTQFTKATGYPNVK